MSDTQVKETQEHDEYTATLAELQVLYKNIVESAKNTFDTKAKEYIERLANILRKKQPDNTIKSLVDIRADLMHDLRQYWSKQWIEKNYPEWLKIKEQSTSTTENEGAGGQSSVLETKEGEGKADADPKDTKIRELKDELKMSKESVTTLQRLQEKNNKRMVTMTEQLEQLTNFKKEVSEKTKLSDKVKDVYDKTLDAVNFIVTGASIQKLENFVKEPHSLGDKYRLVIKFGSKGTGTIDSIKKV